MERENKRSKKVFSIQAESLFNSRFGLGDEDLPDILTKSINANSAVELLLRGNHLTSAVMPLLAAFIVESKNLQHIDLVYNDFNDPAGFKKLIIAAALNRSLKSMKLFSMPPDQHWSGNLEYIMGTNLECQKGYESHPAALCLKRYWTDCGWNLSFPPPIFDTSLQMLRNPKASIFDSMVFIVWVLQSKFPRDVILHFMIKKENPIIHCHITNKFQIFTPVKNDFNEYIFQ